MIFSDLYLFFPFAFLFSVWGIVGFGKLAAKFHFYDVVDGDALKIHHNPMPLTGGLGIEAALILVLAGGALWHKGEYALLILGLVGALPVFLLGLWDDVKWKHILRANPRQKFLFLLANPLLGASLMAVFGFSMTWLPLVFVVLGTALFLFVCINAVNYQDGMDGLAGGMALISFMGFLVAGVITADEALVIFAFVCLGAMAGFLTWNAPPAKVFLGDSGAYLVGALLAIAGVWLGRIEGIGMLLASVCIIGIPIFEGVYTNMRRLKQGKSIFRGDRSHVYDWLLARYSTWKVLAMHYGVQIVFVGCGIAVTMYFYE